MRQIEHTWLIEAKAALTDADPPRLSWEDEGCRGWMDVLAETRPFVCDAGDWVEGGDQVVPEEQHFCSCGFAPTRTEKASGSDFYNRRRLPRA